MTKCVIVALSITTSLTFAQRNDPKAAQHGYRLLKSATQQLVKKQGFNMRIWLGNNGTMGRGAFDDFNPPDGVGLEYPVNFGIEHMYGGGVWFGAIVDTSTRGPARKTKFVSTAYGGSGGGFIREMFASTDPSDTFYTTSILNTGEPNRRNFDDDHDGRIDEDDLDGADNDGDWNPVADDLGSDHLQDSLEVGCKGSYDPLTNPDPAGDNYDPGTGDVCRAGNPLKNDKNIYTQNNSRPDIGEPHVDEDYGAVSESDVYVSYTDTYLNPIVAGHFPMGVKVWQKTYAWASKVKEPIIVVEFNFVNVGHRQLDSVYLAYFADTDVGPTSISGYYTSNFAAYLPSVRTAYAFNAALRPSTPVGITVLGTPRRLDALRYTFEWHDIENNPTTDQEAYDRMSSGVIKPDQPISPGSDTQVFFGFGPFNTVSPGDTLRITLALVSGEGIEQGFNNMIGNASRAIELYNRGYSSPEVPPSPPLHITKGNDRVTLDWKWHPGDPRLDPLETWDDSNKYVDALPDTHWRRRNPPEGHTRGGRIFEGFRLWRSESPVYNPNSFALLRQVDIDDDLKFEYQTGLEYSYTDSNLVRGKKYWYAVTSFSVPGASIVILPDPNGGPPQIDTLVSPGVESDISQNVTIVQLPFAPSTALGEVKVVPNPYRTDADYTFEGGGWEGLGRMWTESKRVVWFIHLPPVATIRIFSIAGDLVATIEHDDGNRTASQIPVGQEEWNLLSQSGRAIASGVYVFAVESNLGRQIGKFVVIR